ncbi:hypothetical protein AM587_10005312 [Phytophthora nicotianae]|uniref:Uncharacterized protein n=1 Tax=Phytophthora nicotianae TaxID=4792 RepID=A0A0W8BWT0_PHYNI|nr:hypothetical protein AM587_10005312 [Phytophthora nicotianae]
MSSSVHLSVGDSFENENDKDCANELKVFECARRFSGESNAPRKYGGGSTAVGLTRGTVSCPGDTWKFPLSMFIFGIDVLDPLAVIFSNSSAGDNERIITGISWCVDDRDVVDNGVAIILSSDTKLVVLNGLDTAEND